MIKAARNLGLMAAFGLVLSGALLWGLTALQPARSRSEGGQSAQALIMGLADALEATAADLEAGATDKEAQAALADRWEEARRDALDDPFADVMNSARDDQGKFDNQAAAKLMADFAKGVRGAVQ